MARPCSFCSWQAISKDSEGNVDAWKCELCGYLTHRYHQEIKVVVLDGDVVWLRARKTAVNTRQSERPGPTGTVQEIGWPG